MSIRETATDRLGPLVPGGKFGYTGRARRYARSLRRSARTAFSPSLYARVALIRTHWWENEKNFGDLLTPLLLREFGIAPIAAPVCETDLVGVGSLVQHLPADYSGTLWGTGLIRDEPRPMPEAQTLALRGELTRDRLGSPRVLALGDPGLLLANLFRRVPQRWEVGVVPHYIHHEDPEMKRLIAGAPESTTVINVRKQPIDVARHIASCRAIVTTSLHGLIVADSLGIPAVWLTGTRALAGGDFKFLDHESVVRPAQPRNFRMDELESLAEGVAKAVRCDTHRVAAAQEALALAASRIPETTRHRYVTPLEASAHVARSAVPPYLVESVTDTP